LSRFNKGTAFSEEERTTFKLHGLLPPNHQSLDEQVKRAYQQYSSRQDDLAKNTFLASMKAQNEVLYYRVCDHSFDRYNSIWQLSADKDLSFYKPTSRRCLVLSIHRLKAMRSRIIPGCSENQKDVSSTSKTKA
jgi:malate dehydrogenase (oxaloacetate-decarboxylating)